MTSLEKAVQEAVARYRDEEIAAARKEEESRKTALRVNVDRRYPNAVISSLTDLIRILPERAFVHLQALFNSQQAISRLDLSEDISSFTTLGGHVLFLSPSDKISDLAHVVNVKSPFAVTLAVEVQNFSYKSAREFRESYGEALTKLIQALPSTGPALDTHWSPSSPEDAARWSMFMPTKRAHIGFYATPENKVYLVMRSHAGSNMISGISTIIEEPDMTAGKFVNDPRIKWMQGIAQRNAARVMYHVARKLGFAVRYVHDYQTFTDGLHTTTYREVSPDIVVHHDTQRFSKRYGGHATFFRDIVDASQGVGNVLIHSDITKGYIIVNPLDADDQGLPVFPMTTGKVQIGDRVPYTIDERDEHATKVRTLSARTELLMSRKYQQPGRAIDLAPIIVVRS